MKVWFEHLMGRAICKRAMKPIKKIFSEAQMARFQVVVFGAAAFVLVFCSFRTHRPPITGDGIFFGFGSCSVVFQIKGKR